MLITSIASLYIELVFGTLVDGLTFTLIPSKYSFNLFLYLIGCIFVELLVRLARGDCCLLFPTRYIDLGYVEFAIIVHVHLCILYLDLTHLCGTLGVLFEIF